MQYGSVVPTSDKFLLVIPSNGNGIWEPYFAAIATILCSGRAHKVTKGRPYACLGIPTLLKTSTEYIVLSTQCGEHSPGRTVVKGQSIVLQGSKIRRCYIFEGLVIQRVVVDTMCNGRMFDMVRLGMSGWSSLNIWNATRGDLDPTNTSMALIIL